jgi:DNA-binding transcriptional ArsR family regulator
MTDGPDIARVAALIGDPARARMLMVLMGGEARTVSELAAEAGVGLPTASAHLSKLEDGGLVVPRKSGRHRYVALASDAVAALIEALMGFSGQHAAEAAEAAPRPDLRASDLRAPSLRAPGPRDPDLRAARVCYNHLAGDRGVQLYDSLIARHYLAETQAGLTLTEAGWAFGAGLGITPDQFAAARPPLCRACLDWSARRSHLGGRLGRAFLDAIETRGWARRVAGTRIIRLTPPGQGAFDRAFPPPQGSTERASRPDPR